MPKNPVSSNACSGGERHVFPVLFAGRKEKDRQRRRNASEPDYLPALQRDLVAVISKYIHINPDDIKVHLERQDNLEVLEVKIELPDAR